MTGNNNNRSLKLCDRSRFLHRGCAVQEVSSVLANAKLLKDVELGLRHFMEVYTGYEAHSQS